MFINYLKNLLLPLFALTSLAIIVVFVYFIMQGNLPDFNACLCQWDCGWYQSIHAHGYVLQLGQESNLAFFPLFPFLWKWLQFSVSQISLFNGIVFVLSFGLLNYHFRFERKVMVLFFLLGLLPFFLVPYSESFFFAGSVFFLVGLSKQNNWLVLAGIFISVASRSASMIFGVAFLFMLIENFLGKGATIKIRTTLIIALLATIFATFGVFYIHYLTTGNFFAFFYAQQFWNHHAGLPSLPLTSWHWPTHISDSVALVLGLASIMIVLQHIAVSYFPMFVKLSPFTLHHKLNATELISLLYLSGTTAAILLSQGGNLHSLNRYVFATPFFIFLINLFYAKKVEVKFTLLQYLIFCAIISTVFPRQTYIEHYLLVFASIFVVPTALFFMDKRENKFQQILILWLPVAIGGIYQIITFLKYFSGSWMG